MPAISSAQVKILPYAGMVLAGFSDGQSEVIRYNYNAYLRLHPRTNQQWSNPKISWMNKYRNWPEDKRERFIGSKTIFAWATDKYHLNRTIRNGLTCGSLTLNLSLYEKPKPIKIIKIAVLSWCCYAAGTQIAYEIYK